MQKLLLKDYDKIKKYLADANYEGYNSNFVTMMMWDHEYKIYYEIKDNKCIVDTVNLNKFLKILNKHYKYKDAKGNIILYKIKREINRVIKQIKCLIIKKNKI